MNTRRAATDPLLPLALLIALIAGATAARAGEPTDEVTARTQRSRNGAGLQVSSWRPDEPAGLRSSSTIAVQGYLQKGIDLHIAWENTLGYWERASSSSDTQPIVGTTTHELQTHLVPALTALRFYPLDQPTSPIEPFVSAGLGPVLGIQQETITGGLSPGNATTTHAGLGVRAGVGVNLRASEALGITAGGHFESASFGDDMSGQRLYRGWGMDVGLSYRFQYRWCVVIWSPTPAPST